MRTQRPLMHMCNLTSRSLMAHLQTLARPLIPRLRLLTLAIVTQAALVVVAPDLAAILASPDVTQVVGDDVNAPLVTIALDETALAPTVQLSACAVLKATARGRAEWHPV